jgi:hypothetical protein
LGTAAAVVLILVIALPMWRTYKEIPNPADTPVLKMIPERSEVPGTGLETRGALTKGDRGGAVVGEEKASLKPSRPAAKDTELRRSPEPNAAVQPKEGEAAGKTFPHPSPAPGPRVPLHKARRSRIRDKRNVGESPALEEDKSAALGIVGKKSKMESPRKSGEVPSRGLGNRLFGGTPAGLSPRSTTESVDRYAERPEKGKGAAGFRQDAPARSLLPRSLESGRSIPVLVRIVDSSNRPIPWLEFKPDEVAAARYRFVGRGSAGRDEDGTAGKFGYSRDVRSRGYLITIRVTDSGRTYDLEGELLDARTRRQLKGERVAGVGREELRDRIDRVVRSLLDLP